MPEKVPWNKMAEILSTKFKAATGRELMPENLQFLSWKILRSKDIDVLRSKFYCSSILFQFVIFYIRHSDHRQHASCHVVSILQGTVTGT